MDDTVTTYEVQGGCLQPVERSRPKTPPKECGFSNEDLECLGCGTKLGCVKPGHCYVVEGSAALKGR